MIGRPSQTDFPGSSTSANLGDRSLAPTSRTHIVNSPNGNTATRPFGFADNPSSHVANMSIEATVHSSGVLYGNEAAPTHIFCTYNNYTQSNGATIENAARPRFLTAEPVPLTLNGVPMVPRNAGPQSTYTHPPAMNMNQYTGDYSHNPPSLHSSQYHNMVTGNNFSSSSSLQMYVHHQHLRVAISLINTLYSIYRTPQYVPNTDLAPSQPAGHPYQPAPSMAPCLQQDPPRHNTHFRPSSGRHRETRARAQDANASSSSTLYCDWLDEDDTLCPFEGSLEDLGKHLTSSHLSGAQNARGRCRWQGCLKENMRRDSVWRHVRETHLNMRRGA
jgi:hypothetical protein